MDRKNNNNKFEKTKESKFYQLKEEEARLINLSKELESSNSPYYYGPATSGMAPAGS